MLIIPGNNGFDCLTWGADECKYHGIQTLRETLIVMVVARKHTATPEVKSLPVRNREPGVTLAPAEPTSRIFKANDIVRARYSLPLHAHRVLSLYLAKLDRQSEDFPLMRIPIREIIEAFPGLSGTHAAGAQVRQAVDDLFAAEIRVERGKNWLAVRWVVTASRLGDDILLRVNPDLRQYLLGLVSRYTSYELGNVTGLRTAYQFQLYEYFRACSYRRGCTLLLETVKEMLAIPPEQYDNSAHFKARILAPSIKVINAVTDLNVAIKKALKDGRRVVGWDIAISVSPTTKNDINDTLGQLREQLKHYGFSDRDAIQCTQEFTSEYLDAKLRLMEAAVAEGGVRNPGAFLREAIRQDWTPSNKQRKSGSIGHESLETQRQETQRRYEYERRVSELKVQAPLDIRLAKVKQAFGGLPPDAQDALRSEYEDSTGVVSIEEAAVESPLVRSRWQWWLCERLSVPETTAAEVTRYLVEHIPENQDRNVTPPETTTAQGTPE